MGDRRKSVLTTGGRIGLTFAVLSLALAWLPVKGLYDRVRQANNLALSGVEAPTFDTVDINGAALLRPRPRERAQRRVTRRRTPTGCDAVFVSGARVPAQVVCHRPLASLGHACAPAAVAVHGGRAPVSDPLRCLTHDVRGPEPARAVGAGAPRPRRPWRGAGGPERASAPRAQASQLLSSRSAASRPRHTCFAAVGTSCAS